MDRVEAEELLRTVFADPRAAQARALADLVTDADPAVASIGHQVVGIVVRDDRQHRRRARPPASSPRTRRAGGRRAGGGRPGHAGSHAGLHRSHPRRAWPTSTERPGRAQGLTLRGSWCVGRAIVGFPLEQVRGRRRPTCVVPWRCSTATDDDIWRARALNLLGWTRVGLGDLAARGASRRRGASADPRGPRPAADGRVHNQGWVAFLAGDLPHGPGALRRGERALRRGRRDQRGPGVRPVQRLRRRRDAGRRPRRRRAGPRGSAAAQVERGDLLLALAGAALAADDHGRARVGSRAGVPAVPHARSSRALDQGGADGDRGAVRDHERPAARCCGVPSALVEAARAATLRSCRRCSSWRPGWAVGAHARGGRAAEAWLAEAAGTPRTSRRGTTRALGWLSTALRAAALRGRRGVLRACERGLVALDEHRATLGSQELRARSRRPTAPSSPSSAPGPRCLG